MEKCPSKGPLWGVVEGARLVRRTPLEKVCMPQKGYRGLLMFFSYILKSLKDGRYYYGSTKEIETRLKKHNKGDVKSTKNRRPLVLHYFEEFGTRSEAFKREQFYKSIAGYVFLKENSII